MSFHQLFNHGHGRSFVIHRWVFFYSDLSPEGFAMSYRAEGLSATKRDHLSDPWKRSWQILSPGFPWLYWNPSETTPWLRKGLQVSSEEADELIKLPSRDQAEQRITTRTWVNRWRMIMFFYSFCSELCWLLNFSLSGYKESLSFFLLSYLQLTIE